MAGKPTADSDSALVEDEPYGEPIELGPDASEQDLKPGNRYKGRVNNTTDYGVFVSLRDYPDEISGLVHVSNLPPFTSLTDFSVGDELIVELHERKSNGDISFKGLKAPGVAPDAPPASVQEYEEDVAEASELADRIDEVTAELAEVRQPVMEEAAFVSNPFADAVAKLRSLEDDGYSVESYSTQVADGGDEVELSVTLSKD